MPSANRTVYGTETYAMHDGFEPNFASPTPDLKYLTPTVSSASGPACQKRSHMSKPLRTYLQGQGAKIRGLVGVGRQTRLGADTSPRLLNSAIFSLPEEWGLSGLESSNAEYNESREGTR